MLKSFLKLLTFIFALIIALEACLRFIYFGTNAFSVRAMNSHVLLLDSDMVQPAKHPEIYYELKPNLKTLFRGKHFVTNSDGLADKEYSKDKPADVFRIAVVGSSWTMATGVATEDAYHSLLEEKLQEKVAGRRIEIINFAVEYYGFREIIGTVKHKALAYNPDMIILASTALTPALLWGEQHPAYKKPETVDPFRQSYLLTSIMKLAGKNAYKRTRRAVVDPVRGAYSRQLRRCIEELSELTLDKDIPVAVLWLTYKEYDETIIRVAGQHAENQGFSFTHINLKEEADKNNLPEDILIGRNDTHPNEIGHRLIAEKVYKELWEDEEFSSQP